MNTRPASPTDSDFVYQVKVDALKDYVTQTWGWDEAFQRSFHKDWFAHEQIEIIQHEEKDIGFLIYSDEPSELKLNELNLLTAFQNKGIGSSIIKEIQTLAASKDKPIWLQVLKVNPAINLYKRLGFTVTVETDTHYQMHWKRT